MEDIKKILFPVDFSKISQKIVPYVLLMAKKFDAEIHLLFVTRVFEHFSYIYVSDTSITNIEQEIMDGAKHKMDDFIKENMRNYPKIKTSIIKGDAAEEIVNYTKNKNIDIIAISTHGRKGLEKILLGSVTEQVIKTSTVPVFIINPHKDKNKDKK